MEGPNRWPTRDQIKPESRRYTLIVDYQAIVCAPCNKEKGLSGCSASPIDSPVPEIHGHFA